MFHDTVVFASPSAGAPLISLGLPWLLAAADDPTLGIALEAPLSAAAVRSLVERLDVAALVWRGHRCAVAQRDAALAHLAPLGERAAPFARLACQFVPDLPA
jgi:hypothetical protein